ncbi:autotransporter domain-containing protein [Phaeobacter sp. B1627]|uniref:DUF7933 domain-containing protein n=1 Tax=Phaeobacter sp. B1627 TaxID=2583809 RepID=UPI0021051CA3|nr:autotransporter domain-containing protein [Phaeobacter sp. B1627]
MPFSFTTNDAEDGTDETTYNVTISGTINAEAEIDNLTSSTGNSVADGGTDTIATAIDSGTAVTVTYTVANSGTGPLNLSALTAGTPSNASFGTTTIATSTVAAGGSEAAAISITFTPGSTTDGASFSVPFSFTTNDAEDGTDETTYNVTISGTISVGVEAEIDNLTSSTGNSVADGGTDDQGNKLAGVVETVTYTVTNSGALDLTLETAVSSDLTNVIVESIGAPATSVVSGGGGTTEFEVQYRPQAAGAFSFDVTFVTSDSDENPFSFTVSGAAMTAPVFTQDFAPDTIRSDETATLTFTVNNSANGAAATGLEFSNTLPTGLSLASPSNAATTCTGGTLTAANGTDTVSYTGGTVGASASCTVTASVVASSDGSYSNSSGDLTSDFGNSGNSSATLAVASPEIDVQRPASTSIASGGTDDQGSLTVGEQQTLTYTIANQGTATLTLSGTPTSGSASNVTIDTISAPGASSVPAGASATFTVAFTPTLEGDFSFGLVIANDDADESSYTLTVSGTAVGGTAEFDLGGAGGGSLTSGQTDTISEVVTIGASEVITYVITNPGTRPLTLITPTVAGNISNQNNVVVNSISLGANTLSGAGASTTLQIIYTPIESGSFSFDFVISYSLDTSAPPITDPNGGTNPGNVRQFSITVEGIASGAPEIEVSSSENGALSDGGTDTVSATVASGTATSITYTLTNSGTDTLTITPPTVSGNVSGATNATVNGLTLGATSLAAGGGTTTLVLSYTATSSGTFGFDVSLSNNDDDENPFNFRVSGTAQNVAVGLQIVSGSDQSVEVNAAFDAPLVVTATASNGEGVADVPVTFTAPASGASLVFASTGTNTETVTTGPNGTATSSNLTANGISSTYQGTTTLAPYAVTASAPGLSSVSFSMTNTRNDAADIRKTQEVIASFIINRANTIVSNQPDLVSRLSGGGFGRQNGGNGLSFSANSSGHSGSFRFSYRAFADQIHRKNDATAWRSALSSASAQPGTAEGSAGASVAEQDTPAAENMPRRRMSFARTEEAGSFAARAYPGAGGDVIKPAYSAKAGWDFWAQGTYAISHNINSDSKTGLFFAGLDYRKSDNALYGVMAQLDINDEENAAAGSSAKGVGWMVGPYAVLRLRDNLYLDVSATYGQSHNKVNALGLFEDDFDTERVLLQGGLTGDVKVSPTLMLRPFARLTYYYEKQKSYTDSLGRTIPSQDFDLGRFEFGPKLSWELAQGNDMIFSPYLTFSGIYDFNKLQSGSPSDPSLASSDSDFRGRLEAGAVWFVPDRDINIAIEGFYDGIGASGFESYGASVNVRIPF